jgi:hypothetical protein
MKKRLRRKKHPEDDKWDWAWLFYAWTVILGQSEESFWTCTLRKLTALLNIHINLNNPSKEEKIEVKETINDTWLMMK